MSKFVRELLAVKNNDHRENLSRLHRLKAAKVFSLYHFHLHRLECAILGEIPGCPVIDEGCPGVCGEGLERLRRLAIKRPAEAGLADSKIAQNYWVGARELSLRNLKQKSVICTTDEFEAAFPVEGANIVTERSIFIKCVCELVKIDDISGA